MGRIIIFVLAATRHFPPTFNPSLVHRKPSKSVSILLLRDEKLLLTKLPEKKPLTYLSRCLGTHLRRSVSILWVT